MIRQDAQVAKGRGGNHAWKNEASKVGRRPWRDASFVAPERHPNGELCRVVKLMPEYLCELPLWYCEWWELDLAPATLDKLTDLQSDFDATFSPERGWNSETVRDAWAQRARLLVEELRAELPATVELEVDLWPLKRS